MTEGPYELPEGWRWVRLGEVASLRMGETLLKRQLSSNGVPVFSAQASDIQWGFTKENRLCFDERSIVIGARGTIGFPKWPNLPRWTATQTTIVVTLDTSRVIPAYLVNALHIVDWDSLMSQQTIPMLTVSQAREILVPLPPLTEQERIVKRLEALMDRVREARRLRQEAREEARRLWQSVLADTFPRPGSALPPGWRWVRLGEVCEPTERRDPSRNPDQEFLYVDISSVDNSEGKIVSPKVLLGREAPSRARKVIREGDVIFATTRPYLKNIALVPPDLDDQICSTGFCVLRPRRDALNPFFLYYVSRSDLVVGQLSGESMRGASYPAVTDGDVFRAQIPLPPLAEQERIVKRLEALQEKLRALEAAQAQTDETLKRLEQAILERAFRGEL